MAKYGKFDADLVSVSWVNEDEKKVKFLKALEEFTATTSFAVLPTPQVTIPHMDLPGPEGPFELPWQDTIHRCSFCGKWSHAKKKPSSHQSWTRSVAVGKLAQSLGRNVDTSDWGGWKITNCGPFVTYHAVLTEKPPHGDG